MRFCDVCDNMLYVSTDADENLKMYCKNCNFHKSIMKDSVLVLSEQYKGQTSNENAREEYCIHHVNYADDTRGYKQFLTPNIKYDKTLPRVNNISCPSKCEKKEVIYIKYDPINMKFLYYCCVCEKFWTKEN